MTKKTADIGSKRLISLAPDTWVKWVTEQPNLTVEDFLTSDFQWVSLENDVLLRVNSPEHGKFLVLNQIQLRYNNRLPRRMRAYAALAEERYNMHVYPVLVNILPLSETQNIPNAYRSNFLGLEAVQAYRVINLWEVDVNLVFQNRLSTLLPFVPILQGGSDTEIVKQAVRELRADEQLQELEPLLAFFASFVLDSAVIQEILRWDMAILRESPWYQEILKEGVKQGRERGVREGIQQGRERGVREGKIELVLQLLSERFGELGSSRRQPVENLSAVELDELTRQFMNFTSLEDFDNWLDRS
ncbi:Rpn family recombination-promoting nuclease/putative transposase [Baaleninema sp.]|uniref:Rpn family recombination-promoting nuclease/putative transposase n=1 Tax=Baaleninema sp. TaxID=3101197 RepID=UPI003CFFD825